MKFKPAFSLLLLALSTAPLPASMFDTDYQDAGGPYNWAPLRTYSLGGIQQTDTFRDLTFFTHGTLAAPSFTSPGGVTLAGGSTGSYIKWGLMGSGTMPPTALLNPIMSGTVTEELLAANPVTPKAIDADRIFSLSCTNPVEGLQSIVLQLRMGTIFPVSPAATPFEMAQMYAPVVLSLNGGSIWLEWDFRELTHVSADPFSTTYTQEVWSFQWDLSDIGVPITDFTIHWDSHPYGNLFGAQIDQSSVFTQAVDLQTVPEPSTWALVILGLAVALWKTRRRQLA